MILNIKSLHNDGDQKQLIMVCELEGSQGGQRLSRRQEDKLKPCPRTPGCYGVVCVRHELEY